MSTCTKQCALSSAAEQVPLKDSGHRFDSDRAHHFIGIMDILFKQLYGMASMTAMDAKIEEQLQHSLDEETSKTLLKIYESNDLDERDMIIANKLGYREQYEHLRERLRLKRNRPSRQVHDDPSSW